MTEYSEMPLKPELIEAVNRIGWTKATEVQEQSIPVALQGKDLMARAKTGTGKTGAFLIPILQRLPHDNRIGAIVIVPTRELAVQVADVAHKLATPMHYRVTTVYGGASINVQMDHLRRGVNIVVGTPGRILDLIERGALRLDAVKYLVLDEADTMLDMGFIDDIELIISRIPAERQTMLFSATFPRAIADIARHHMKDDHAKIIVGKEEELTVTTITHLYHVARGREKFAALLAYIDQYQPRKAIIFSRTKHESEIIHDVLVKQNHDAILLHGGLTQARRENSLHRFKEGAKFLIATNVASRGLDIQGVTDVINFDAPETSHDYVHRVGRSARMGKEGRAFTLVAPDQIPFIDSTEHEASLQMKEIALNTEKYRSVDVPFGRSRRFDDRRGGRGGGGDWHGRRQEHGGRGGGFGGHGQRHSFHGGDRDRDRGHGHGGGGGGGEHRGYRPRRRGYSGFQHTS